MQRFLTIGLASLLLSACLPQQARDPGEATTVQAATHEQDIQHPRPAIQKKAAHIEAPAPAGIPQEDTDIWDRVRAGMRLPDHDHPGVRADREWYASHPEYLNRVITRATPYLHLIVEAVAERDLPMELVLLPIVESAYQPFAYSSGHAAGLWQFIPGTGKNFKLKQNWWYDGRRDIVASTRAALDYLEYLRDYFDGEWLLAIAAYNSGEGAVGRAIKANQAKNKNTDFWSLNLSAETRSYVPKLLAVTNLFKEPEKYGLNLTKVDNTPFLGKVELDGQIDLALAAELADISLDDLYMYNPGFNRWATDPDGPHELLLPLTQVEHFRNQLAELPADQHVRWERYRIQPGETLSQIARDRNTTVELIRTINKLPGNSIRAGDYLMLTAGNNQLAEQQLKLQKNLATSRKRHTIHYAVQSGDSLWSIARRHNTTVKQLSEWNRITPQTTLRPGQKLAIHGSTTSTSRSEKASGQTRIDYIVRSGDSLHAISQRFKISLDKLISWNKLDRKQYLQPGQKLTLYIDPAHSAKAM